ncbi:HAD superfamily hydrolase (TIGR01509 family) [Haloactinospora alba]|uniref:HAD superfamily hydrolase (TIGR01509 family) n=1 Tax=Haloactinospora alba TaxID=405555 RepID=A0A543NJ36_9ACTN|nr:HAD family phosphatase [Haloactinospora alba]TQN31826.1 HAD superfamily hydrolase (TIGR01509 family) [Haloactinospora alba]
MTPVEFGDSPAALPQAVLFDMDGTLIDSEGLWHRAEAEAVAELGGQWSEVDHQRNIGGAAEAVAAYIADLTGTRLSHSEITGRLHAVFVRLLAEGTDPRTGASELVALVAASPVPSALVTSTERALLEKAITSIGIDRFDVTLAGDEVRENKPHPEPYRAAARALGADPARCVAFEDSPVGVASALAAGCATVAVATQADLDPAPGLTLVDDLTGIDMAWLARLVSERNEA